MLLGGCSNFFSKTTTTTTTSTASTTGNYAFVANEGSNTLTGYSISTAGVLTALSGTPLSFTLPPTAAAVSRSNNFLWVGTASQIFGYAISSSGAITPLNSGATLVNANCTDMQTTPDGKYLMVLDGTGNSIDLFTINSDGTLSTAVGIGFTPPSGSSIPHTLRINPAGTMVAASLGTAGEMLFSFSSSTATLAQLGNQTVPPNLTADYGNAWDPTGSYLYVVRVGTSAGLVVNRVSSTGTLTPTTSTVYATGDNPYAVTLDNAGTYAYVANHGSSNISAWTIGTNAALTAVSGSPFTSGSGVAVLGADSTSKYLLAVAPSGSPDLSLYSFDATVGGKLDLVTSTATGTTPSFLALSH